MLKIDPIGGTEIDTQGKNLSLEDKITNQCSVILDCKLHLFWPGSILRIKTFANFLIVYNIVIKQELRLFGRIDITFPKQNNDNNARRITNAAT